MNESSEPKTPEQSGLEQRRWVVGSDGDVEAEVEPEANELLTIDELAESLGYVETAELRVLRASWVEAIRAGSENAREFAIAYQEKAEEADARHLENFRSGRRQVSRWMSRDSEADAAGTEPRPLPEDPIDAAYQASFRRGRMQVYRWLLPDGDTGTGESEEDAVAGAAALGFVETDDARALRARIAVTIALPPADDVSTELAGQILDYRSLVNRQEAEYGAKFQIGLLVAKATIQRDGGRQDYYLEDLGDALFYAENVLGSDDEAVKSIAREFDSAQS